MKYNVLSTAALNKVVRKKNTAPLKHKLGMLVAIWLITLTSA